MYGMGGTVSCVFVTISSPRSHTNKQHVFPASSRLKPPFVQRPDESARSVALHRLIHRSLPQTWPTTPYTAPRPPSREASREGGT